MGLKEDIISFCGEIFRSNWVHVDGRVVPETKDLALSNHGKTISAAVLYADLDQSTTLVDKFKAELCAEIYKAFLRSASRIISSETGSIRSFDGDRVMGVFMGDGCCNNAVRAAMKINWAVKNALNPALKSVYNNMPEIKHTVGVDFSDLLVVRAGMRDSNDLVWVGKAANHAAKLNGFSSGFATRITRTVYDRLDYSVKCNGNPVQHMWQIDPEVTYRQVYRSNWSWTP